MNVQHFKKLPNCFQSSCTVSCLHQQCLRVSVIPHGHQHLVFSVLITQPFQCQWYLIIVLKNSFTEKQFTCHTIYPFKLYNSVAFSIFTKLYVQYHNQFQNMFVTPKRNPALLSHHPHPNTHNLPIAPSKPQATTNLLSVSIDFAILDS